MQSQHFCHFLLNMFLKKKLQIYIYIFISYIKCNVVTLYERILTCFIIYRNAILTFLTLFVKYDIEKKNYKFYVEKIMKIEKRLHDFLHLKRTK